MKSVYRVPTPITRSAVRASSSAVAVPVWPMPPTSGGVVVAAGSPCRPGWRRRGCRWRRRVRRAPPRRALWWTPPPATIRGRAGRPDRARPRRPVRRRSGRRAAYVPDPLGEELLRPVVRLRLHVLRQRERDGAGLDGVGEDAHGLERGRDQGLGAGDPVEVAARPGAGVSLTRHVARVRDFELLEDRVRRAGGEDVAGEQQHREVVDGGEGGAGDEVGGAGADGGGDGVRGEAVRLAGVADGGVHHRLLVAALVVRHVVGRTRAAPGRGPATLPWPKMPQVAPISRCRSPSRSVYWAARKRTSAWATVSRMVVGVGRRSSVPLRVVRVEADPPLPLGARAGHHVQVVHVVAGLRRWTGRASRRGRVRRHRSGPRRGRRIRPRGRGRRAGSRSRSGRRSRSSRSPRARSPRPAGARRACAAGTRTSCRRG